MPLRPVEPIGAIGRPPKNDTFSSWSVPETFTPLLPKLSMCVEEIIWIKELPSGESSIGSCAYFVMDNDRIGTSIRMNGRIKNKIEIEDASFSCLFINTGATDFPVPDTDILSTSLLKLFSNFSLFKLVQAAKECK